MPVYDEVRIATWSHSIPLYSRISCTAMPIGAPPRQTATRKVGRKPLRTTCKPSSIESRSSEFAEMKIFSMGSDDILTLRAGSLGTHLAPSKIPQQMQREFRRLARRDRPEPQIVVVGGFLGHIAAGAHNEIRHAQGLANMSQRRRFHFHDVGMKPAAQLIDALLRDAENIG